MGQRIITQSTKDRRYLIDNESDFCEFALGNAIGSDAGTTTAYTNSWTAQFTIYPGFNFHSKGLTLSSRYPCDIFGYAYKLSFTSQEGIRIPINLSLGAGNLSQTILLGEDFYEGGAVTITINSTTTAKANIGGIWEGQRYINDTNYNAKFTAMAIGDSISWTPTIGNFGASGRLNYGNTHWFRRLINKFNTDGIDVRPVMKGFGGSFAADILRACNLGHYDLGKDNPIDFLTIGIGTNDAVSAMADVGNTYTASVTGTIDYFFAKNPNMTIVLIGPPGSDTTGRVTNLASYRTALQAIVALPAYAAKVTANQLKYVDSSTGLTVNDTNYVEQGANNHIHPKGDTGHLIYYNNVYPVGQSTKFYLDATT